MGGTEKATIELIQLLKKNGSKNVKTISIHHEANWQNRIDNTKQSLLKIGNITTKILDRISHFSPHQIITFVYKVNSFRPNIIVFMNDKHISLLTILALRYFSSNFTTIKFVHDISGSCIFQTRNYRGTNCQNTCRKCNFKLNYYKFRLSRFNFRIYNSQFTKDVFTAKKKESENQELPTIVFPIYIKNEIKKIKPKASLEYGNIKIGIYGTINKGKGQKELLEFLTSMRFVKRIVLVGEIKDKDFEKNQFLSLMKNNKIFHYKTLPIDKFCQKIDCAIVYPRNYEGFGRTVVELSEVGIPLFVKNEGGLKEAIKFSQFHRNLVVPIDSFRDLYEKLSRFANNGIDETQRKQKKFPFEIFDLNDLAKIISQ